MAKVVVQSGADEITGDNFVLDTEGRLHFPGATTVDVGTINIEAGEAHIGEVGGNTVVNEVTLSLDTGAYADGDVLADTQEVASAMRVVAGWRAE